MTLSETVTFFENLESSATKKSQKKLYKSFVTILNNLQQRELDATQVTAIETTIDNLDLKAPTAKPHKFYRKKLTAFTDYLRKEFSLIPEGHYTSLWMVYGMTFGTALGISFGTAIDASTGTAIGLSMGAGLGMALGMIFGAQKDAEAKKQNRVLA